MPAPASPLSIKVLRPRPVQDPARDSFVGGRPKLPPGGPLPACVVCGSVETFFFQVAFPEGRRWAGWSLAVFQCTACEDPDHPTPFINQLLIPSLKKRDLERGDDVPDGAIDLVQRTFRFPAFPTADAVVREDYDVRVAYRPIDLVPQAPGGVQARSRVGGVPYWTQVDSTPGRYRGEPLEFLMQWRHGFEFARVPGSPAAYHPMAAILPDLANNMFPYSLFTGLQLYFFGNRAGGRPNIYMATDVP